MRIDRLPVPLPADAAPYDLGVHTAAFRKERPALVYPTPDEAAIALVRSLASWPANLERMADDVADLAYQDGPSSYSSRKRALGNVRALFSVLLAARDIYACDNPPH